LKRKSKSLLRSIVILRIFFLFTRYSRIDDDEIDKRCDDLRDKLTAQAESGKRGSGPRRTFKEHEVHEMADAKIKESERLRRALKISSDYEEGSHWRRQEERLRSGLEKETEDKQ